MLVDELSTRCFNGTWLFRNSASPSALLAQGGSCLLAAPR